jgi:hypothetical protein
MASSNDQIKVSTAGCCLAIITAQHLGNQCDGYGLLFGTVSREDLHVVNDMGSRTIGKTAIHIQAFSQLEFFRGDGSVDEDCIMQAEKKLNAVCV